MILSSFRALGALKFSIVILLGLISITFDTFGQTPVKFEFGQCTIKDASGTLPNGFSGGAPQCVCGLTNNSFQLNGADTLFFANQFSTLFSAENFTFDTYFTISNSSGNVDVFSVVGGDCTKVDSSMSLKYFAATDELFFVMGSNVNNLITVKSKIDLNICWHRFTLVKSKTEYFIYIDNVLKRRFSAREIIPLSVINGFRFSGNPCRNPDEVGLQGRIDHVSFKFQALSALELLQSYLYPDQIINRDTTIFAGNNVVLKVGSTCGQNIQWIPDTELVVQDLRTAVATPSETITYTTIILDGSCQVRDSVAIFIADPNSIDCNQLLLPRAFTPNNDGLNDTYGISNTFIIDELEFFEIYDRTGALIWKTSNINETWDASFNGQPVSAGMFLSKVKYTCGNEKRFFTGAFTLLR